MSEPVLQVRDLSVYYYTMKGIVKAVENVSLEARQGEHIALVGESGSGKSTLGYAIINLIPPPGKIVSGRVVIDDTDILSLKGDKLRKARGSLVSIVFQDPFTTLDPVKKVGEQIKEVLTEHGVDDKEAEERVKEVIEAVGLPRRIANSYPHQLSGGQRQRISIAAAIALRPKVLIADEPTTALDVIVQKQIMDLIDSIRELGTAVILVTHDIALAAERATKIAVMYAGNIVEFGPKDLVLSNPLHPYTKALLDSVPGLATNKWPEPIPGFPPDLTNPPSGCRFHPRCRKRMRKCVETQPPMVEVGKERKHFVSCWLYSEEV